MSDGVEVVGLCEPAKLDLILCNFHKFVATKLEARLSKISLYSVALIFPLILSKGLTKTLQNSTQKDRDVHILLAIQCT